MLENNLFTQSANKLKPLADRMRPNKFEDFIGQKHIVSPNSLLSRAIMLDKLGNCIFFGPPGSGKTSLANIIANMSNSNFQYLNAVSSGISDAKVIIEKAKVDFEQYNKKTYLFLDECHRWNKTQSDFILSFMEKGIITFIGATTENPYANMTRAIISRCRIFEFKPLEKSDILTFLEKAIKDKEKGLGNYDIQISKEALDHFAWVSAGDLRVGLNGLELAVLSTTPNSKGKIVITKEIAEDSVQKKSLAVNEDLYYDFISAFCKSLRGSDSDAALYWAERLIQAGCDPLLILRRLIVHSSEDVGMADPMALVIATSALQAFKELGLPEGKIPMYNAIIYICEAEKSNSVIVAKQLVEQAVLNNNDDLVPEYLQDQSYKVGKKSSEYLYPHDFGGWVKQTYLPHSIKDKVFYKPLNNGFEATEKFKKKYTLKKGNKK